MVNGNQAHMPWMISKINEALYGIHSAHKAASLEAITHLYRVPDSEHIDIIVGFVARASGRRAAIQLLRSRDGRQLYQSTTRFSRRSPAAARQLLQPNEGDIGSARMGLMG
jgi:hypothetical protein